MVPAEPPPEAPPPSIEQQDARSASLLLESDEAAVARDRMAKARRFGIVAAVTGGLGAAAAIGSGISFAQRPDVCVNTHFGDCIFFISNNQVLGGFLGSAGIALGVVAITFAIIAVVNYALGQRPPDAVGAVSLAALAARGGVVATF